MVFVSSAAAPLGAGEEFSRIGAPPIRNEVFASPQRPRNPVA